MHEISSGSTRRQIARGSIACQHSKTDPLSCPAPAFRASSQKDRRLAVCGRHIVGSCEMRGNRAISRASRLIDTEFTVCQDGTRRKIGP